MLVGNFNGALPSSCHGSATLSCTTCMEIYPIMITGAVVFLVMRMFGIIQLYVVKLLHGYHHHGRRGLLTFGVDRIVNSLS